MKKQVILFLLLGCCAMGFSQNSDYHKLVFSISGGMDFPLGKTGSQVNYTGQSYSQAVPIKVSPVVFPAQKGFTQQWDAAFYFSRHYGVGITYHYNSKNVNSEESNFSFNSDGKLHVSEGTKLEFDENVGVVLKTSELYSHIPRMTCDSDHYTYISRNINRIGITAGFELLF